MAHRVSARAATDLDDLVLRREGKRQHRDINGKFCTICGGPITLPLACCKCLLQAVTRRIDLHGGQPKQAAEKLDLPDKFVRKIPQGPKAAIILLNLRHDLKSCPDTKQGLIRASLKIRGRELWFPTLRPERRGA
jgi:hypothetical protein